MYGQIDVAIGDIVLLHRDEGSISPCIVVNVISPTQVQLYQFSVGGSGGDTTVYQRGTQPGQWEPKPKK